MVHPGGGRRARLREQQEASHGLRGGGLPDPSGGQDRRGQTFAEGTAVRLGLCQRWTGGQGACVRRVQYSPNGGHNRRRRHRAWPLSGSRTWAVLASVEIYLRGENGEVAVRAQPTQASPQKMLIC